MLVALALVVRLPRWLGRRWVPAVVAALGGVVAAVVGLAGQYAYGWDARVVMDLAGTLDSGRPLPDWGIDYLSLYPNNLPLLAIDQWGHAVARRSG